MQFRLLRQTQLEINDGRIHMATTGDDLVRPTEYSLHRTYQGRQTGGGGVGVVSTPLEFWMGGGGVEHLSTPPDFEKKNFRGGGGVGSP